MSPVSSLDRARALKAIDAFRPTPGCRAASDRLFAPAPSGLSLADADALVREGLAFRGPAVGRQTLIVLTEAGLRARDGERGGGT